MLGFDFKKVSSVRVKEDVFSAFVMSLKIWVQLAVEALLRCTGLHISLPTLSMRSKSSKSNLAIAQNRQNRRYTD